MSVCRSARADRSVLLMCSSVLRTEVTEPVRSLVISVLEKGPKWLRTEVTIPPWRLCDRRQTWFTEFLNTRSPCNQMPTHLSYNNLLRNQISIYRVTRADYVRHLSSSSPLIHSATPLQRKNHGMQRKSPWLQVNCDSEHVTMQVLLSLSNVMFCGQAQL